jgi:hypothetical protein
MADEVELAVLTAGVRRATRARRRARRGVGAIRRADPPAPECRNVDLLASATESGRFLVIEKWDSPDAARAHLDTELMTDMAQAAVPLLAAKPRIDLLDTISAHDLM